MSTNIKEEFIHYIWRTKQFDLRDLKTISGRPIIIKSFGEYNHNAGPDFLNAVISIDEVTWAGHIEMHIRSSDWLRHLHSQDPAYDSVILHVVLDYDAPIMKESGEEIEALNLHDRIDAQLAAKYQALINTSSWIPCDSMISEISPISKMSMLSRCLADRLMDKSNLVLQRLNENQNDWSETLYQYLAWALGLSVNGDNMLILAQKTPYKTVLKHSDQLPQIEALLFGQAGMLTSPDQDEYTEFLHKEYMFLAKKYGLTPMRAVQWKYMRMRPGGFPTIRIAQLAKLIHTIPNIDQILFDESQKNISERLIIQLDRGYWHSHYRFGPEPKKRIKTIGQDKRESIIINAIAPVLYAYGRWKNQETSKDRAINLLESLRPENNSIIKQWRKRNVSIENAADSQAALQLKKHYCAKMKCLDCSIGHKVLNS